jgi:uncharacterized protein (TIGR03083 family)
MANHGALLAAERRALADLVETLGEDQLRTPSLCEGWTVRDVVAHVTLSLDARPLVAVRALVQARGSLPRAVQVMTADAGKRTTDELVALLRERAELRWSPPGFGLEAPLTDIVVHGVDLRRPLGIRHEPEPDAVRTGLDFVVQRKAGRGFTHPRHQRGLRFVATDLDWSHGTGPVVQGPALPLLVALCSRPAVLEDLEGDGVPVLRERLRA